MTNIAEAHEITEETPATTSAGSNPARQWAQLLVSLLVMRDVLTLDDLDKKGSEFENVLMDGLDMAAQNGSYLEDFAQMRHYAEHAEVWKERRELS